MDLHLEKNDAVSINTKDAKLLSQLLCGLTTHEKLPSQCTVGSTTFEKNVLHKHFWISFAMYQPFTIPIVILEVEHIITQLYKRLEILVEDLRSNA